MGSPRAEDRCCRRGCDCTMRVDNPGLVMSETQSAAVNAVLIPLLRALEMLALLARYLHPPDTSNLMAQTGAPEEALRLAMANQPAWPETLAGIAAPLDAASTAALQAF